MGLITTCAEHDEERGVQHQMIYIKPIAYNDDGVLRRIDTEWTGGEESIASSGPFEVRMARDGTRRIIPRVAGKLNRGRWFELGAPRYYDGARWVALDDGQPVRSRHAVGIEGARASLRVRHGGHFIDEDIVLGDGFRPARWLLPIDVRGVVFRNDAFWVGNDRVMRLRPFVLMDAANEEFGRLIPHTIERVDGRLCAVLTPDYSGCFKPIIDPTLDLQPDAAAGIDTYMNASLTTRQYGTTTTMMWGAGSQTNRGLIKFNLGSIPAGSTISSAVMSLYVTDDYTYAHRTHYAYRVRRAWVEPTVGETHDPATGACWNRYDATNNWTTGGCEDVTNDREESDVSSVYVDKDVEPPWWINWTFTPAKIEDLDLGNGWLLKGGANSSLTASSSDNATAADRPKLSITYTLPPSAQTFVKAPGWGRW